MNDFAKHCDVHPRMNRDCQECRKAYQRWHYQENKGTYKAKHAEWYQANKVEHNKRVLKDARKRRYGVDDASFQRMLQEQGSCCAICSSVLGQEACVDHNHQTGQVRGLLCKPCNMALGLFWDDPKILNNAAYYLEKYKVDSNE